MAAPDLVFVPLPAAPARDTRLPTEISATQDQINASLQSVALPIVHQISDLATNAGITPIPTTAMQPWLPLGSTPQESQALARDYFSHEASAGYSSGYTSADLNAMLAQVQNSIAQQMAPLSASLSQATGAILGALSAPQHEMSNDLFSLVSNILSPIQHEIADSGAQLASALTPVLDGINSDLAALGQGVAAARQTVDDRLVHELSTANENSAAIARSVESGLHELVDTTLAPLHEISTAVESFLAKPFGEGPVPVLVAFKQLPQDVSGVIHEIGAETGTEDNPLLKALKDTLGGIIPDWAKALVGVIQESKLESLSVDAITAKFEHGEYRTLSEYLKDAMGGEFGAQIFTALFSIPALIATITRVGNVLSDPFITRFSQLANAETPTKINDVATLVTYLFRNPTLNDYVRTMLGKHGLNDEQIQVLLDSAVTLLPLDAARQLFLRGEIDENEHNEVLAGLGYDNQSIEEMKKLYHFIPPAQDLTRIADKRIWSLQTAAKYGQYAEVPPEYGQYMAQLGYEEKWVNWFWASHWNLPSPPQIFEMFHRGKIDQEDIETYLGLTDWLPFFRDKLREISYSILTRVDIRRIYKNRLMSDERLHRAHLDLGYTEEDAKLLDDFVKHTQLPEDETEITSLQKRARSAVESAYRNGKLSRSEAHQRLAALDTSPAHIDQLLNIIDLERPEIGHADRALKLVEKAITLVEKQYTLGHLPRHNAYDKLLNLGFSESQADITLSYLDLEYDIEQKEKIVKHVESLYISYQIDGTELVNLLSAQGFTLSEINEMAVYLNAQRQYKERRPTDKEIIKFYELGIIDKNTFYEEMRGHGYADKYINWFAIEVAKAQR